MAPTRSHHRLFLGGPKKSVGVDVDESVDVDVDVDESVDVDVSASDAIERPNSGWARARMVPGWDYRSSGPSVSTNTVRTPEAVTSTPTDSSTPTPTPTPTSTPTDSSTSTPTFNAGPTRSHRW